MRLRQWVVFVRLFVAYWNWLCPPQRPVRWRAMPSSAAPGGVRLTPPGDSPLELCAVPRLRGYLLGACAGCATGTAAATAASGATGGAAGRGQMAGTP